MCLEGSQKVRFPNFSNLPTNFGVGGQRKSWNNNLFKSFLNLGGGSPQAFFFNLEEIVVSLRPTHNIFYISIIVGVGKEKCIKDGPG